MIGLLYTIYWSILRKVMLQDLGSSLFSLLVILIPQVMALEIIGCYVIV